VVGAAIGQSNDVIDHVLDFGGVDEVRHAELLRPLYALRIDVDPDDLVRAHHLRALDHIQTDAAQTEHHHVRTHFHLRRVHRGAHARRYAAADVADLAERCVFADLRHGDLRHDDVV